MVPGTGTPAPQHVTTIGTPTQVTTPVSPVLVSPSEHERFLQSLVPPPKPTHAEALLEQLIVALDLGLNQGNIEKMREAVKTMAAAVKVGAHRG